MAHRQLPGNVRGVIVLSESLPEPTGSEATLLCYVVRSAEASPSFRSTPAWLCPKGFASAEVAANLVSVTRSGDPARSVLLLAVATKRKLHTCSEGGQIAPLKQPLSCEDKGSSPISTMIGPATNGQSRSGSAELP